YQGGTTVTLGSLRLGNSEVVPNGSTVTVNGGTFDLSGWVKSVTINSGGSGYAAPTVAFSGGGGSGAAAPANTNTSGTITAITITGLGTGYTSAPTVTATGSGGSGTGASLTAVVVPGPFSETVGNVILTSGTISGAGCTLTGTNYDLRSGTISANLAG